MVHDGGECGREGAVVFRGHYYKSIGCLDGCVGRLHPLRGFILVLHEVERLVDVAVLHHKRV